MIRLTFTAKPPGAIAKGIQLVFLGRTERQSLSAQQMAEPSPAGLSPKQDRYAIAVGVGGDYVWFAVVVNIADSKAPGSARGRKR